MRVNKGVCESSTSAEEKKYKGWHSEVKASHEGGDTPEMVKAKKIASEAITTQLDAHEARRIANEAEERAKKLENRARMMIHAAADATAASVNKKEPEAKIPDGGLGEIIKAVGANSTKYTLLELFGQEDKLDEAAGIALANALKANTNVKTVNLANGMVGDAGAKKLSEMLMVNQKINQLNLKSNAISDEGAYAIAEMLRKNRTLTYLNVGNAPNKLSANNTNQITNHGLKVICDALHVNSTLKKVVFNNLPNVTDFGAKAVMEMVEVNRGLTDVYLEGRTGISSTQRQSMRSGNSTPGVDEELSLID